MIWLDPDEYLNQKYIELRIYAPKSEAVYLDFNPLKISNKSDWNPLWEEWHCYSSPLRIYKQDYNLLLKYFNKIYPTKDAIDNSISLSFDICSDNWIKKSDWQIIVDEIENDNDLVCENEKKFFLDFLNWIKTALTYTTVIVVEGNQ